MEQHGRITEHEERETASVGRSQNAVHILPHDTTSASAVLAPVLVRRFLALGEYDNGNGPQFNMTALALRTSAQHFRAVPRHWKEFVALGLFAALTTILQGKAYTLTLLSYVEAVKQVEILFAMAIGVLVFGEAQRVRESALGAVAMLVGMVLLALAG